MEMLFVFASRDYMQLNRSASNSLTVFSWEAVAALIEVLFGKYFYFARTRTNFIHELIIIIFTYLSFLPTNQRY